MSTDVGLSGSGGSGDINRLKVPQEILTVFPSAELAAGTKLVEWYYLLDIKTRYRLVSSIPVECPKCIGEPFDTEINIPEPKVYLEYSRHTGRLVELRFGGFSLTSTGGITFHTGLGTVRSTFITGDTCLSILLNYGWLLSIARQCNDKPEERKFVSVEVYSR